jgi:hypothetical protein
VSSRGDFDVVDVRSVCEVQKDSIEKNILLHLTHCDAAQPAVEQLSSERVVQALANSERRNCPIEVDRRQQCPRTQMDPAGTRTHSALGRHKGEAEAVSNNLCHGGDERTKPGRFGWEKQGKHIWTDKVKSTCHAATVAPTMLLLSNQNLLAIAPCGNLQEKVHREGERSARGRALPLAGPLRALQKVV